MFVSNRSGRRTPFFTHTQTGHNPIQRCASQEKTIAELKSGMTALATTVKEQAAQIQKVSAQLEASKPAPQVVNNP
jgi:hypothetical protein